MRWAMEHRSVIEVGGGEYLHIIGNDQWEMVSLGVKVAGADRDEGQEQLDRRYLWTKIVIDVFQLHSKWAHVQQT